MFYFGVLAKILWNLERAEIEKLESSQQNEKCLRR